MPTIGEIVEFLQAEDSLLQLVEAANSTIIHRPAPIAEAGPGEVSFCGATARNPQELLERTRASLLIIDRSISFDEKRLAQAGVQAVVLRDNARLDFIRVVDKFFAHPCSQGIHPTTVVSPSAKIAPDVYVGPLCSIGEAEISEGTVIHGHVHIYSKTRIGRNVIIHAGTVIGADGFGYQRNEAGELEKFPHVGGVVIEDNVEIGSNTSIDRGTLKNTIIREGVKINNLVHIAHNVVVGRHAAVNAHVSISGSTRIGDYAWIAPCACLRDGISIGARAIVGLGAVVTKDVPDDTTVMGAPARPADEFKEMLRRLAKET